MFTLSAKTRIELGKKDLPAGRQAKSLKELRNQGQIPAVVYGPGAKNISLQVDEKEFKKVFQKAGESSLIELEVDKEKKPVLVHEIQKDPVSDKVIHIDFFQASLKEEVEVKVPLVFKGSSSAEKDLGGTLNKNMLEVEVKALPQNLPHEIIVNVDSLKTFQDHVLIKDLILPKDVKVLKKPNEIVVSVLAPRKVEEELAEVIEEKVEDIEKVVKEKKVEDIVEEVKEEKK